MASTRLIAALLAGASLVAGCSSSSSPASTPPPTFTTADLAGTWRFAIVLEGVPVATSNVIGWRRGEATIDTSGVVTYTSVLDSFGTTTQPAATTFSVDTNGVVIGSLANVTDFNGQLSRGKDLIIATSSQSGASVALRVWQKIPAGTAYSAADLPGTWSYHQVLTGSADGWEHGVATVNALGGLALSGRAVMTGALADVPAAGTLSIDANGWVALDSNPSWLAFMSPDKSRLVAVETTDAVAKSYGLNVIVRTGHVFAPADLAGDFAFRLLDSSPAGGLWARGHVAVAASGNTVVADQLDSTGDNSVPAPFTFSMTSAGMVTSPDLIGAEFHGQLSPDGQLLAASQNFGAAEGGVILAVRK